MRSGTISECSAVVCNRPKLRGVSSTTYGADVNRCVENPIAQLQALPQSPALRTIAYPDAWPQTSWVNGDHWQTIVRLPSNPNLFFVTLNQEDAHAYAGFLGIIDGFTHEAQMVQPNDTSQSSNRFNHPGGAQALGKDYLFVAEEQEQATMNARVRIYKQQVLAAKHGRQPTEPIVDGVFSTFTLPAEVDNPRGAAAVAVTKLAPLPGESASRYLLMVASVDYSYQLLYWVSQPGAPLTAPGWEKYNFMDLADPASDEHGPYYAGWGPQQNMNLLTECGTGALYLVSWGMVQNARVRLHRLDLYFNAEAQRIQSGLGGFVMGMRGITPVATRDLDLRDTIDFSAGAGSYVTSDGRLEVHGTSKRNPLRVGSY
jgi:hypothetical protein